MERMRTKDTFSQDVSVITCARCMRKITCEVFLSTGSMECYCYLRNVQDLLADGETPYERQFGEPSIGPIIPFGAMVEYHPISVRDQSRLHQFGKKFLPGIFLGYELLAGGIWKGDFPIAELEKLNTSDIYPRRINAKETKR